MMPEHQNGNAGYVYILINAAFPEFIKIGLTTLDPKERAKQLSTGTGIPAPYAVAWRMHVSDCRVVEQTAHAKLAPHRVRNNREFFRLSVEDAIEVISTISVQYKSPSPVPPPASIPSQVVPRVREISSTAPDAVPESDARPESEGEQDIKFLSVEGHTADEMAPKLKPEKVEVLRKLREAILQVAPDCLWRMRNDGKITFTPLPHRDRSKFRNLMTVHLQESPVGYRIGKVVTRFSDDKLPEIDKMLRDLLAERG